MTVPVVHVADALLAASRALVAVVVRSLDERAGELTLPQVRTLVLLSLVGPQTVGQLTARVGVHQSTVTRLVERLLRLGLVDRGKDPRDRRLTVVQATADGRALVDDIMERRRVLVERVLGRMEPDAAREAVAALEAFSRAAEELDDAWEVVGV